MFVALGVHSQLVFFVDFDWFVIAPCPAVIIDLQLHDKGFTSHVIDTPLFPSRRRHGRRGFLSCYAENDKDQENSGSKTKQIVPATETDGCFRA